MSDLTEFLSARLDEDEAAAKDWRDHDVDSEGTRFGTHRIFAEVKANRGLLEEHWRGAISGKCQTCGTQDHPCTTLRLLAAIWQDHPDYRREWRP